jgi:propionyl-CoA carboxylase alpha chain
MIAKLIVHGRNREEAIARMIRAIDEYRILGLKTTLDFCKFVMKHEAFTSGNYNTNFVSEHFMSGQPTPDHAETGVIAAAFAAYLTGQAKKSLKGSNSVPSTSQWRIRANEA